MKGLRAHGMEYSRTVIECRGVSRAIGDSMYLPDRFLLPSSGWKQCLMASYLEYIYPNKNEIMKTPNLVSVILFKDMAAGEGGSHKGPWWVPGW